MPWHGQRLHDALGLIGVVTQKVDRFAHLADRIAPGLEGFLDQQRAESAGCASARQPPAQDGGALGHRHLLQAFDSWPRLSALALKPIWHQTRHHGHRCNRPARPAAARAWLGTVRSSPVLFLRVCKPNRSGGSGSDGCGSRRRGEISRSSMPTVSSASWCTKTSWRRSPAGGAPGRPAGRGARPPGRRRGRPPAGSSAPRGTRPRPCRAGAAAQRARRCGAICRMAAMVAALWVANCG
jgi:hypothetical protein